MALSHRQPDRVPLDIGASFVTSINVSAYRRLRKKLGMPDSWQLLREQTQSVLVDEEVRQALGVDVIGLYECPSRPDLEHPDGEGRLFSEWGLTYQQADGFGDPYTLISHPLADATLEDLQSYPWPDPLAPERFEGIAEEAAALRNCPYAVVGNLG